MICVLFYYLKIILVVHRAADLRVEGIVEKPVLPPSLSDSRVITLPASTYTLMVVEASDVGNPAYGQLQKLHSVDTANSKVGEEEDELEGTQTQGGTKYQAAWQPKPSRATLITLTDGFQVMVSF